MVVPRGGSRTGHASRGAAPSCWSGVPPIAAVIVLPGYCQSRTWIPEEALCPCLPPNYALPDADLGSEKCCPFSATSFRSRFMERSYGGRRYCPVSDLRVAGFGTDSGWVSICECPNYNGPCAVSGIVQAWLGCGACRADSAAIAGWGFRPRGYYYAHDSL